MILCKDCKWYDETDEIGICRRPIEKINCGKQARWFEAKESD